jgi:hypothetical protein
MLVYQAQGTCGTEYRGTFSEFVINAIITDYAIRSYKEGKKRKVVAAQIH